MENTFLNLENNSIGEGNFAFVGINYCSAKYLLGVERAADKIRHISYRYANADGSSLPLKIYNPENGYILRDTTAYDLGNISASSLKELEAKLSKLVFNPKCIPIFAGGDHSVTYELVKRMAIENDDFVVLQFDAHSDYIGEFKEYPHGSVMNEVNKITQVSKIIHFGLRGNLNSEPAIMESYLNKNIIVPYYIIKAKLPEVLKCINYKKVYITFDTDFLNPAYAPATNFPEPGGPSYEETVKYFRQIISSSKEIIGMDFVEYNPTCEGANLTGITIVNLIMEVMSYISYKQ